ncbi:MAG: shikimate dehydrogenase [Reyranella sp.]|uniref:shikimate dehydrogenase n=1 Tax=Reyranella sp. TaxID=1929291 RepID=UPI001AD1E8E9|nr:shikimate dehydrogenase [Reyranella sp.]MBN9087018.1 shikimate dehydrogenase [Reyranella sp.]
MNRILVGLIGANIQQSLSPALHEDAFAAIGMVGHYHLMDVDTLPGRTLPELLAAARTAGFAGVNVTFPFKEAVIPLLDDVSDEARQIGAVNTVVIDASGRTTGHNTDRSGFRTAFAESFGKDAAHAQGALQLGAGGAGRAVAFALLDLGVASLRIYDRDHDRARKLCADLGERAQPLDAPEPAAAAAAAALIVNATPIGMQGHPGLPMTPEVVRAGQLVADVIYTPLETEFLKAAKKRKALTMGGAGMCVHQAADAFRHFAGRTPDIARLKRIFAAAAERRTAGGLA